MTEFGQNAAAESGNSTSAGASAESRLEQLRRLHHGIADLRSLADTLSVPFIAIHLDHALALCGDELARSGHDA